MPFDRPTLQELRDRMLSDLETRLDIVGASLRNSFTKVFGIAFAGAAHLLHGHIVWASRQLFYTTAEGEFLDIHGDIWGITREPATYADGFVTFTGVEETEIAVDTELVSADGIRFATTEAGVIDAGSAIVPVRALTAGDAGNADVGTVLSLSSPTTGLDAEVTVSTALTGGADQEEDEDYRERIGDRVKNPPLGGTEADFETWAKSVPGVTRAWAYGNYLGEGTVGIFFLRDDDASIYPSTDEIEDVSAVIEENKYVTARHYVFSPSPDVLDFEIELSPNSAAVQAAVEAELQDLLDREAEPGGTILLSHINEAISLAAGETDHVLVSPSTDFVSPNGFMAEYGEVTWS